ncbi:MAG TPA: HNH endonuclease [Herpetosiphonaceae bacterium]
MTISAELRDFVRRRAHFACEYCGVTETDTGGELTIDHYQPQSIGGTDEPENLLYCCVRCNQYKADYWPTPPNDPPLWNPRTEPTLTHFLRLEDGTLYPLTPTATFTSQRLRLNRSPLIAYRRQQNRQAEERRLLVRYRELLTLLEQIQAQHLALLQEHRQLLEEQRTLIRMLLNENE